MSISRAWRGFGRGRRSFDFACLERVRKGRRSCDSTCFGFANSGEENRAGRGLSVSDLFFFLTSLVEWVCSWMSVSMEDV